MSMYARSKRARLSAERVLDPDDARQMRYRTAPTRSRRWPRRAALLGLGCHVTSSRTARAEGSPPTIWPFRRAIATSISADSPPRCRPVGVALQLRAGRRTVIGPPRAVARRRSRRRRRARLPRRSGSRGRSARPRCRPRAPGSASRGQVLEQLAVAMDLWWEVTSSSASARRWSAIALSLGSAPARCTIGCEVRRAEDGRLLLHAGAPRSRRAGGSRCLGSSRTSRRSASSSARSSWPPNAAERARVHEVHAIAVERRRRRAGHLGLEIGVPSVRHHAAVSVRTASQKSSIIGAVGAITRSARLTTCASSPRSRRRWAPSETARARPSYIQPSRKSAIHAGRLRPEREPDHMGRVRRRGRDHAVDPAPPHQSADLGTAQAAQLRR